MSDIVLKLKMIAHLKAEQNKGFGRVGKAWAKESELEWQAATTIAALLAALAEAVDALKPFGREAEIWDNLPAKDRPIEGWMRIVDDWNGLSEYSLISVGDLRRARAVVEKVKDRNTVEKQNSGDNP